jgi:hypothetical protein
VPLAILALFVLLVCLGALVYWAALIPLPARVRAPDRGPWLLAWWETLTRVSPAVTCELQ